MQTPNWELFHGEKTYKLPEKDCVLALWASWEEGAGLSWARPLTLGGKETCLPAIGSLGLRRGGGWRCLRGGGEGGGRGGGSYFSSLKADSKFEVVPLGCAHTSTSKQDLELPGWRPL